MSRSSSTVMLVAGEASGDRLAASVARTLRSKGTATFGMGGLASARADVELLCDMRNITAMGTMGVGARLPRILGAYFRLARAAERRRPVAAALFDFTEFNLRLGRALRARGTPVLWCGAPQVWAWRPGRIARVRTALDRLAVLLPFEESLWRKASVDAHYIGHPALDAPAADGANRAGLRRERGLADADTIVALLPGSRPHEVKAHLPLLLDAYRAFERRRHGARACVLSAPSLDAATRSWIDARVRVAEVRAVDVDAERGLGAAVVAFDAAVAVSGTATLECALAGVPLVVVYRADVLTAAFARALVRSPHVALPNVLLRERRYPELLQADAEPERIASELVAVLADPEPFSAAAEALRRLLSEPLLASDPAMTAGARAARLLEPWLLAPGRPVPSSVGATP